MDPEDPDSDPDHSQKKIESFLPFTFSDIS